MVMRDLIAWEWYRDKKTGQKHRRLSIPRELGKKHRLIGSLIEVLERATECEVILRGESKIEMPEKKKPGRPKKVKV